jgi:hypothetical protein
MDLVKENDIMWMEGERLLIKIRYLKRAQLQISNKRRNQPKLFIA